VRERRGTGCGEYIIEETERASRPRSGVTKKSPYRAAIASRMCVARIDFSIDFHSTACIHASRCQGKGVTPRSYSSSTFYFRVQHSI